MLCPERTATNPNPFYRATTVPRLLTISVPLATLAFAPACKTVATQPDHCSDRNCDATCVQAHGDVRPYCTWKEPSCASADATALGCVFVRPIDECYSPCGGAMVFEDDFS